jgi:hypothetical protein
MSLQPINKFDFSIYFLILANLVPILGIIFFGWSLLSILALYWTESVIIGFFNVLKMLSCKSLISKKQKIENSHKYADYSKLFLIPFFIVHYGLFTIVHGVFILVISMISSGTGSFNLFLLFSSVPLASLSLFISHGISFFQNYIGKKEYENVSIVQLLFAPYKRVVIMHLVILLGMFVILITGAPVYVAILFVALKIFVDILTHNKEHFKISEMSIGSIKIKNTQ